MNGLKFALRQLPKNSDFAAVAVFRIATGIWTNTAGHALYYNRGKEM